MQKLLLCILLSFSVVNATEERKEELFERNNISKIYEAIPNLESFGEKEKNLYEETYKAMRKYPTIKSSFELESLLDSYFKKGGVCIDVSGQGCYRPNKKLVYHQASEGHTRPLKDFLHENSAFLFTSALKTCIGLVAIDQDTPRMYLAHVNPGQLYDDGCQSTDEQSFTKALYPFIKTHELENADYYLIGQHWSSFLDIEKLMKRFGLKIAGINFPENPEAEGSRRVELNLEERTIGFITD